VLQINEVFGERKILFKEVRRITFHVIFFRPYSHGTGGGRALLIAFLTLEDGTDRLSRNVGTELPLYAAEYPRRAHISC